jgi:two-component system, LytTR family, response regulator
MKTTKDEVPELFLHFHPYDLAMPTKVLLIDDEERATDSLRLMIERFIPQINHVRCCNDATTSARWIHDFEPDLIFLDIRMPHLSGFELLDLIPNKNFKVIFTTAYDEYAIKAIRFSAFDYLLKPVDVEELIHAVDRFFSLRESSPQEDQFKNFAANIRQRDSQKFRLALPSKKGVLFFYPEEIERCEAEGNYTRFYLTGGDEHVTSKTLGEYDQLLTPYNFIRVHKSHLVNKDFISFIDHDGFIVLRDDTKVEISRRRKKEVMATLMQ